MKTTLCACLLAVHLARPASVPAETRVTDRPGARVVGVAVERGGEGWSLSGRIHGAWLRTASRRTVRVAAVDETGAKLAETIVVARRFAEAPGKIRSEAARFEVAVPDPAGVARYEIAVVDP